MTNEASLHVGDDEYQARTASFKRASDWVGLAAFCRNVEKRIARSIRRGTTSEDDQRLRIGALLDLQIAYSVLRRPDEEVAAGQEAIRAAKRIPLDPINMHFMYLMLARAYKHAGATEKSREAIGRAITSVLTKSQTEFVLCGLEELEAANSGAITLRELAEILKKARRVASRSE